MSYSSVVGVLSGRVLGICQSLR